MKIIVKKRGASPYYDEFLYVASFYKRFKRNPKIKAHKLTSFLKLYLTISGTLLLLLIALYLKYQEALDIFLIGVLVVLFLFMMSVLINTNKRIKLLMSEKGEKTVIIDKNGVKLTDEIKSLQLKWDDMESIILNKYSICFLPKEIKNPLIGVSIDYKNDIIKAINDNKKESLIVNNN